MRIISGELKGKKLLAPLDKSTRPLKDMVRESIFNILDHSNKLSTRIYNAKVLDLFSGTGSFGIECLSRGAAEVSFFENYNNSLKILSLKLEDKSTIFNYSAYNLNDSKLKDKIFDIIFLDPPFKNRDIKNLIDQIKKLKIADLNSLLIIHRNKKSDDKISQYLDIIEEKNYGLSKIFFCKLI